MQPKMRSDPSGIIFDIKKFAIHDGPGIRTTIFFKGCPLQCVWCHNPESWLGDPEHSLRVTRCVGCRRCVEACPRAAISVSGESLSTDPAKCVFCGRCVEVCPTGAREILGRRVSVGELISEIDRDVIFYDQSGGGVTCSGGEPLMQPTFLEGLLKECKAREIHTVLDTTCYAAWEDIEVVGRYVDLFLVDLKQMDPAAHKRLTGVSNEPILRNLRGLVQLRKEIVVRIPIIPGLTDGDENIRATGEFMASLGGINRVDLLPHNEAAGAKASRLVAQRQSEVYRETMSIEPPTATRMDAIARQLETYGFLVKIGG